VRESRADRRLGSRDREALRKEFRLRGWRASVIGEGASPRHPLLAVIDEVQEGA
jgi:hypothetical protein